MGILGIIGCCFVCFWVCLPSLSNCHVTLNSTDSFPSQPVKNGNVTLTCNATGFDPNAHMFTWQRLYNSSFDNVIQDDRRSFSPPHLISEIVRLYSQSLTITNLTKSDEGFYLPVIIEKDTGTIITNGQVYFTVNSTEEFPVCFPDGPAVLNEGDILTCSTVIDERTPMFRDIESDEERTDWVKTLPAVNDSGSQLQKIVKGSDDGVEFVCISFKPENKNWTSLSCKIGPLTVISYPTTTPAPPPAVSTDEPGLDIGVIIGITIPLILLVGLVTILVSYFMYRRKMTSNTTSDKGPNQQNPSHIYATSIREDSQASSTAKAEVPNNDNVNTKAELHNYTNVNAKAEVPNYDNVNPSPSNLSGVRTDLSWLVPSSNTPSNQKDVTGQTGPYMELGPQDSTLDVYTELKL
ncbi:uncharacterized protein [Asterias amurensis]|uniref:uncharacterized protein n=1 Tax=Asterias amurensis TaxID=7602 RepID=UPI003AB88FFC